MTKFDIIRKVAAAVTAVCAFFAVSCRQEPEAEMSVSATAQTVSFEKGNVFVNVKCPGAWALYLVTPDGGEVDWAEIESGKETGTGNASLIVLYYKKNTGTDDRTLKIVLDNGVEWRECLLVQECEPLVQEPEEPDPIVGEDLAKTGWLELPALDNPELEYYSHSFVYYKDNKTYRNYSFGWSQKDRVAVWVAYPLCRFHINGTAGRTEAWALDPLLGNLSAAPFGGYAGKYDRGHQLPSGDRQCDDTANAQTFYGTNMVPQLNQHNTGIWVNLENKVRAIAKGSDTTYVVTGVILSESSKKEKDSYGKSVTVPDAFFKALLRYGRTSTVGQWNAVAFYLEHREYTNKLITQEHSMSIDALEELTGIDFFVNLPAKVGETEAASIEAADPSKAAIWWSAEE